MPASFYEAAWIFAIYAFFGWCAEVAYAALELKKFVNRGFLNGPVCPIYGCGALLVVVVLTPFKENFLILFFGSFLLTSAIEFVTGFLLEKLFHNQWWDYSDENFNICGYVCLKFSILWGLACTLIVDVVHPAIYKAIRIVPKFSGMILLIAASCCFAADLAITVTSILKFNRHLKILDETAAKLKEVSNEIGENIYKNTIAAVEKGEKFKETVGERVEEEKRLQLEYRSLMENAGFGTKRLMKAFPKMKSRSYQETLTKLRGYLEDPEKKE